MYDLRTNIRQIQSELNDLDENISEIPEMIESSNLLRLNEFLLKSNEKRNNLISQYVQYSTYLEQLISSVFEIQTENNFEQALSNVDSVVLLTAHKEFNNLSPSFIASKIEMPVIIDTKRVFDLDDAKKSKLIFRL